MFANRNPQSDIMGRVRELGTLSPKWEISVKSYPYGSENPSGEETERLLEPGVGGDGGHQGNKAF